MLRFDLIVHFPVVNFREAGLFVVKDSKVMAIILKTRLVVTKFFSCLMF